MTLASASDSQGKMFILRITKGRSIISVDAVSYNADSLCCFGLGSR